MKKSILFLASILFLTVTILSGCQTSTTKGEKAEDTLKEEKKSTISGYQQFKLDADQKITDQEKNIAEFKARIAEEKKENRADYEKRLVELENKNSDLKKKLADLKDDGQDKWTSFKTEFDHDMNELGEAFKDLTVDNKWQAITSNTIESFSVQGEKQNFSKDESLKHNTEQDQFSEFFKRLSAVILDYSEEILFGPTNAKIDMYNTLDESRYNHFASS